VADVELELGVSWSGILDVPENVLSGGKFDGPLSLAAVALSFVGFSRHGLSVGCVVGRMKKKRFSREDVKTKI